MRHLDQRIETLNKLRKELVDGDKDRKITVGSYLMLLDYHIGLLGEVNCLANAINEGDEAAVKYWIEQRVNCEQQPHVHSVEYKVAQHFKENNVR